MSSMVAEDGAATRTMTTSTESRRVLTWPIDRPWLALLLAALIGAFIAFALPQAKVDFSLEQLYPQGSTLAKVYQEHKDAYGADDTAFFVDKYS